MKSDVIKRQEDRLINLWNEGIFNTEFYRKKLNNAGLIDFSINSLEDLRKLPIIYKDDLRCTTPFQRTNTGLNDIFGIFSSSGTTGSKTYYIYNNEDKSIHEETVKELFSEFGVSENDIGAILAPIDSGVMGQAMMWQFSAMGAGYVVCPVPSPDNIAELICSLPVTAIATMPSVAYSVLCNPAFMQAAKNSTVDKLLLGGSFLSDARRKVLEDVWKAHCYNCFGMSEVFGPMAAECRFKDGLHYPSDKILIEVLNPETLEPVSDGEIGVAVYTTLWKKGFPLIRYWSDDFVYLDWVKCNCGSNNPKFYYKGRLHDSFKLSDGQRVFPVDLEEVITTNNFWGEYQAMRKVDGTVNLRIECLEPTETTVTNVLKDKLEQLFKSKVTIELLSIGQIEVKIGKPKRFFEEHW